MKTNLAVLIAALETRTHAAKSLFTALVPCFDDVKQNEKELLKVRNDTAGMVELYENLPVKERELFEKALPRFSWTNDNRPDIWRIYEESANKAIVACKSNNATRIKTAASNVGDALKMLVAAWEQRIDTYITCSACGKTLRITTMEYHETNAVLTVQLCGCKSST